MTVLKDKQVSKSLVKKGFVKEPRDHMYFVLYDESGKRTSVRTKTSHNHQDIGDFLIARMQQQLHLSKNDFLDLINCPLSREEYLKKLRKNGVI